MGAELIWLYLVVELELIVPVVETAELVVDIVVLAEVLEAVLEDLLGCLGRLLLMGAGAVVLTVVCTISLHKYIIM